MEIDWHKEFGYGKYVFTLAEIRDLTISSLILGFLFSSALRYFNFSGVSSIFVNFLISTAIVAPALIFHELAHKFVSQKYGCVANYVLWPMGAVISILLSLTTGFIFAALGAVMISTKYSTRLGYKFIGLSNEELGKIAWAGPMTNFGMAILGFVLYPFAPQILNVFVQINLVIALFNMMPFPPLDGAKIFVWSRMIWGGTTAAVAILLFLPGYIRIWLSILIAVVTIITIFLLARAISPWKHPEMEHRF